MAEEVEEKRDKNGSSTLRKIGVRILETIVMGALIMVGGYIFLVPKMGYDVEALCKSVAKIEKAVETMASQIVVLQIADIKQEGQIELLRDRIDRKGSVK